MLIHPPLVWKKIRLWFLSSPFPQFGMFLLKSCSLRFLAATHQNVLLAVNWSFSQSSMIHWEACTTASQRLSPTQQYLQEPVCTRTQPPPWQMQRTNGPLITTCFTTGSFACGSSEIQPILMLKISWREVNNQT